MISLQANWKNGEVVEFLFLCNPVYTIRISKARNSKLRAQF